MDWHKIEVSSKIVGHISAGIYRSPAGALKELVSNAFDADATRVAITTNWPSFDIITCRDNGSGMTQEAFKRIMLKGIGDSTKRVATDSSAADVTTLRRPIVGWLGIGMLGIAQICHGFKVISHHKASQTAFTAEIRLPNFPREEVRDIPRDIPQEQVAEDPVLIGHFQIEQIAYDSDKAGTYVIASDLRSTFIKRFRETSTKIPIPTRFSVFLEQIHKARSAKTISDYWQMVWELTVACPVPYIEAGPFDWDNIEEVTPEVRKQVDNLQQSSNDYQFEVVVDGLSLRKPNQYPLAPPRLKREGTTGSVFTLDREIKVYGGRTLKLSGYIYLQNSCAVEPMELRGLLVRIRNIAIGSYDATLFNYPQIPTPRFNWISGEIYVEEGLESALNIDRASFNEMDSHFVRLKDMIHDLLENEIFPAAYRGQRKRSQEKHEVRENERRATLNTLVRQRLGNAYTLTSTDEQPFPVTVDTDDGVIIENDQSAFLLNSRGNKREVIKRIAYAFEISMQAPEEERRETFYEILSEFVKSGLL